MSKSFLFITPLTPKHLLTPLRTLLFEQYINALKNQTYDNWQALLIGDENKTDGNITYVSLKAESKEIKLIFAKEYILNLSTKPDYIIRIDDDDVINPHVLNLVSDVEFDCYADKYHAFYDLISGKISLQSRNWFANTVIHKYEHAMKEMGDDKIPLLQCDHSKDWLDFYSTKKIIYSAKNRPIYLRVLSPTTVTSGIHGLKQSTAERYVLFKNNAMKLVSVKDIDFEKYRNYLKGFGRWKYQKLNDFKIITENFEKLWANFSGTRSNNNFFKKIQLLWHSLVD